MKRPHKHAAVLSKSRVQGWSHCVTPRECAADPRRQSAHGGIVRRDTCRCGATRLSELNGGRVGYGPWEEK